MAYCKNCGTKLDDGAKFCPKCGTPSGSETKQDTETKKKKSSKKGGLIAAIVVAVIALLGGAAWYFDIQDESVRSITHPKIQEREEKRKQEEEERRWNDDKSPAEHSNNTSDYSSDNVSNNQAEVSNALSECESQIRSIQSEIENLCNTYVQLISCGDADEFKHETMRMTLIRGVGEWQSKANTVFDRCIRKLNSLGETNAANRMQQEKRDFYNAAEKIKNQALQRTGDDYYN